MEQEKVIVGLSPGGTHRGRAAVEDRDRGLTCASLCWLSASPGCSRAWWASWISMAEPSITHWAESSMAAEAWGSMVLAATPRAAWASVRSAWAVSLAATPGERGGAGQGSQWTQGPIQRVHTTEL